MASLKITIRSSATEERTVEVPIPSSRRPLGAGGNTEVREFLAQRKRERKAAVRARRIKRTCLAIGAATAVAVFVVPKWRARARTEAPMAHVEPGPAADPSPGAPAASPAPTSTEPGAESTAEPRVSFDEPISLANIAPVTPLAAATVPASGEASAATEAPPGDCHQQFTDRRWRAAVESCTRAFEATPDGGLALKIAHAHWARSDVRLAGEWAQIALARGTTDADAYVLLGHAERRAGNAIEAVAAYRQYLRASPRGWHARNVRAALRRMRPAPEEQTAAAGEPTAQIIR